jgi:hypothetical protein
MTLRAMLAGERNPQVLRRFSDRNQGAGEALLAAAGAADLLARSKTGRRVKTPGLLIEARAFQVLFRLSV